MVLAFEEKELLTASTHTAAQQAKPRKGHMTNYACTLQVPNQTRLLPVSNNTWTGKSHSKHSKVPVRLTIGFLNAKGIRHPQKTLIYL